MRGNSAGHCIEIAACDRVRQQMAVVELHTLSPYRKTLEYRRSVDRIIGAVPLGIINHDANFLVIHPNNLIAKKCPHIFFYQSFT